MTGGMLPQHNDTVAVIDLCRASGKPIAIGGPAVTSVPHAYRAADFQVLGEAEGIIDEFVAAWEAGARRGVFEAKKFQADVTKSPIPRFDLLKGSLPVRRRSVLARLPISVRILRHHSAYGRGPRLKTNAQMMAELDRR